MFSWASFFSGLFLGMLVVLIVGWVCYQSKTFVFAYCPGSLPTCAKQDYFNNPGDALASGVDLTGLLYSARTSDGTTGLFYRRPTTNSQCVPENPTVELVNPQYCSFVDGAGTQIVAKQVAFNAPDYLYASSPTGPRSYYAETVGRCQPAPTSPFVAGAPLTLWDPSPLTAK